VKIKLPKKIKRSRVYQRDITERTLGFSGNTLIVLPTGGGKTFIATEIAKRAGRVLFLAPKVNLLEQTFESFAQLQPQKIHANAKYDEQQNIFISTLQTISRNPDIIENLKIDMIIIDEVHFGHSGKMQEVIKNTHKGKFTGLSATPYDIEGKLIEGYGNVIDEYDIDYMIKHKYLTPVEIISPIKVNLKNIQTTAGDYNIKQLDFKMSNPKMITAVVESSYSYLVDKKKTLVFAVSIIHAEKLAVLYRKVFKRDGIKKKIAVLHSNIDKTKRIRILNNFKNKDIDILISVDMIKEGMDAPQVDSEVIARPTKSQNLYKQIVGRGMRLYPSKKVCFIIDCGNVVETLGMPMSPIVEREKLENKKRKQEKKNCSICNKPRNRVLINENGMFYKVCAYCGGEKELFSNSNVHQCSFCGYAHTLKTHEKSYKFSIFGIGLKCAKCQKITELSFFKHDNYFDDQIKNAIATFIFLHMNILSRDCFLQAIDNSVNRKRQSFLKMLFVTNNIDALSLYKFVLASSKSIMNNCLQNTTQQECRDYFTREISLKYGNLDSLRESILMELKYYEKHKTFLQNKDYAKATAWYLEDFKEYLFDANSRLQLY